MDPKVRIERLRAAVADREVSVVLDTSALGTHRDFEDFSERSGPGDKEPSFTDFADSAN